MTVKSMYDYKMFAENALLFRDSLGIHVYALQNT